MSVHRDGEVTVTCGAHSHGQGHETTFRQVISSKLGCDPQDVEIVFGDTAKVHAGLGTYASRAMVLAGSALSEASDRVIAKGKRLAAHAFECAVEDVDFSAGNYAVAGTDRVMSFAEIATIAWRGDAWPDGFEPGIDESCYIDLPAGNTPSGFHLCVVEVDKETGAFALLDYLAADDFGRTINPLIVDGQVHGAVTQGLGQALGEWCVYDDTAQLLAGSPMDYQLLRARICRPSSYPGSKPPHRVILWGLKAWVKRVPCPRRRHSPMRYVMPCLRSDVQYRICRLHLIGCGALSTQRSSRIVPTRGFNTRRCVSPDKQCIAPIRSISPYQ